LVLGQVNIYNVPIPPKLVLQVFGAGLEAEIPNVEPRFFSSTTTPNKTGTITLNRPGQLNALNLEMIRLITPTLQQWESDNFNLIIIKAAATAKTPSFCAGGDIVAVTKSASTKGTLHKDFFKEEYLLNKLIGTLSVPYVALIDGICMGGGVGLSVHGSYRVATERTVFAMPEAGIGLFPDVGGSYFLSRLGGKLGLYLALTGHRLKSTDVLKAGIATHMCPSSMLPSLEKDLINNPKDVDNVLQKYTQLFPNLQQEFSLKEKMSDINRTFGGVNVEGILDNLKKGETDWGRKTLGILEKNSPTSLKISMRLLEAGANLDLQECLSMEYRLSQRCCRSGSDFIEGVRALLIDKDQKPMWNPSSLEKVTNSIVEGFFAEFDASESCEELGF